MAAKNRIGFNLRSIVSAHLLVLFLRVAPITPALKKLMPHVQEYADARVAEHGKDTDAPAS